MTETFSPVPWDRAAFALDCYEIKEPSDAVLAKAAMTAGHFTVKVDPLSDKSLLHKHGFYYTDTLLEPRCTQQKFVAYPHSQVTLDLQAALEDVLPMCDNSFVYGRFHRDFNLSPGKADQRYRQWLSQLHQQHGVLGLLYEHELAGFIACQNDMLCLHAVASHFRGHGLAKYLWSAACLHLFEHGAREIRSSVSAANLAVVNLYASLGFNFGHAVDVYHRLGEAEA